eukprot:3387999-Rhodomonas_salina.1
MRVLCLSGTGLAYAARQLIRRVQYQPSLHCLASGIALPVLTERVALGDRIGSAADTSPVVGRKRDWWRSLVIAMSGSETAFGRPCRVFRQHLECHVAFCDSLWDAMCGAEPAFRLQSRTETGSGGAGSTTQQRVRVAVE